MAFQKKNVHPALAATDRLAFVNLNHTSMRMNAVIDGFRREQEVPPFGVLLANDYWKKWCGKVSYYKTEDGKLKADPAHPWTVLRWYDLGLDIGKGVTLEDVGGRPISKAERGEWNAKWKLHPIDVDKFHQYFDPAETTDWNVVYEPRGYPTLTHRQVEFFLNLFPMSGKKMIQRYTMGVVNRVIMPDGKEQPGGRNQGKPFVDDPVEVQNYAIQRENHIKTAALRSGLRPPVGPQIANQRRRAGRPGLLG